MTTDAAQPPVSFPRQEAATRRFRLGLPRAFRLSPDGGRLAFIRSAGDQSLVRYGYYPHNVHFMVTSAQMAGDMDTAIGEAKRLRTILDPETSARIG